MSQPRIGLWFIGARGGVAATSTLGLLAMQKGLAGTTGLVTALADFARLDLADWGGFVVSGHEIRDGTIFDTLERLQAESRVLDTALLEACRAELQEIDARVQPGSLAGCGATIGGLAAAAMGGFANESPSEAVDRLQRDLREFRETNRLDRVIVVNLASTEPVGAAPQLPARWQELSRLLDGAASVVRGSPDPAHAATEGLPPGAGRPSVGGVARSGDRATTVSDPPLPASSLYAIAALDLGMPYINFTPSLGATPPAIQELAILRGTCHAGRDGKTGETLLKSVLAPMFAARNLDVMSWVGHNIFGNLDGQVLEDPANKAAKIKGKDALLGQILGYDPQTLVSIEFIRSLGDWKTAWDHIHFRGFLDTPMTLQLTWQGCDSLLAAPLVLDLVRLVEFSARRGETGVLSHLASFFKQPLAVEEHDFSRQFSLLRAWAEQTAE